MKKLYPEYTIIPKYRGNLPSWILPIKWLYHNKRVPEWCALPYPGHPKGCPNYGQRPGVCPPNAPYVTDVFDLNKPLFFIIVEFDLVAHMSNMHIKHPNWSDKQLRNCLYWQEKPRKQLRKLTNKAMFMLPINHTEYKLQALGINVYTTCRKAGIPLQRIRTLKLSRHISVVGSKK